MAIIQLQKAKEHFKSKRELVKLDIPEWGGEVYYYPIMSVVEKREVMKFMNSDGSIELEGIVHGIIERCRDRDGKRIFKKVNRVELMHDVDSSVLQRIFFEMRLELPDMEEAEKN